jgi:hypothetical protein
MASIVGAPVTPVECKRHFWEYNAHGFCAEISSMNARACISSFAGCLLALMLVLPLTPAYGATPFWAAAEPQLRPHNLVKPPGVSLEQATNIVRRQTGGRVLSAAPAGRGGQRGYEVRVLVDGKRVTKVFVDDQGNMRSGDK